VTSPDLRSDGDGWFLDAKCTAHSVRAGKVECGKVKAVGIDHPVILARFPHRRICPACKDAVTLHWLGRKPA
jgi:hypothetical protein